MKSVISLVEVPVILPPSFFTSFQSTSVQVGGTSRLCSTHPHNKRSLDMLERNMSSCVMRVAGLLLSAELAVIVVCTILLQLAFSPPLPSPGQFVSVVLGTHLSLKVEGVIEHAGKSKLSYSSWAAIVYQ